MKDFFENQESARKDTITLIVLFFLALALIILSVYVATSAFYFLMLADKKRGLVAFAFWDPLRILIICGTTILVIIGGTVYKLRQLSGGGYKVAEMLGGRRMQRNTSDLGEKKLLNVVEEMAIASGVPVPESYVMDKETGINAFVAGHGIDDAVVCVTKGCLEYLNRDELQAVVAHEFSHILNGDMALNIRLMGWLHGILLIGLIGEGTLRSFRFSGKRGGVSLGLLGVALFIIGYIGLFFGKLIKSAVSRQREFLADASAVQFTRNPQGLAGALKKIGGMAFGPVLMHPRAGEASHMFICDGVGGSMFSVMATHPPLAERILRLDPRFDGVFPVVKAPGAEPPPLRPAARMPKAGVPAVVTGAVAAAILESIGAPMAEHAMMARELLDDVPDAVRAATRDSAGARALVYVLLLDGGKEMRAGQISSLGEFESPDIVARAKAIAGSLPAVPPRLRLPLVDLSAPALRGLSAEEYAAFKVSVRRLIAADRKVSLFEYVLGHVLIRRLDAHFLKPEKKAVQIYGVRGVARECSCVLSLMARVGHPEEQDAARTFAHGSRVMEEPGVGFGFLSAAECSVREFDRALDKLASASPLIKRKLLAACLEGMAFDKAILPEEAELFRAVGEALGCPMPPWLLFREG